MNTTEFDYESLKVKVTPRHRTILRIVQRHGIVTGNDANIQELESMGLLHILRQSNETIIRGLTNEGEYFLEILDEEIDDEEQSTISFYALVETYSDGQPCIGYVSDVLPYDKSIPCAGEYATEAEAKKAADDLRRLLHAGVIARKNAEYQ